MKNLGGAKTIVVTCSHSVLILVYDYLNSLILVIVKSIHFTCRGDISQYNDPVHKEHD